MNEADRYYRSSIPDQDRKHEPVADPESARAALVAACARLGMPLEADQERALDVLVRKGEA